MAKTRKEQIDGLPEALENKADKADVVPYEGATENVHLGNKSLKQRNFTQFSLYSGDFYNGSNHGISGYWKLNLGSTLQYGCYFDLKFSGGYNAYNSSGIIGIRGHLRLPYIYEVYTARGGVRNDLYFEPELFQDEDGIFFLKIWKRRSGNINIYLSGIIARAIDDISFELIEDDTLVSASNSSYLLDYNNFYNTPNLSDYALQSWVNSNFATTNEINNIYDLLSAKANDRLSNVASNLSQAEKDALLGKIGATLQEVLKTGNESFNSGSLILKSSANNSNSFINRYRVNTTGGWSRNGFIHTILNNAETESLSVLRVHAYGSGENVVHHAIGTGIYNSGSTIRFYPNESLRIYLDNIEKFRLTDTQVRFAVLNTAGFVKADNNGFLSVDTNDYATEAWVDNKLETIELTPGPQGDKPAHQWNGTSVRFENPNGSWGTYVNLKGDDGSDGKTILSGTSNPANSLGKVGDWHLNRTTWDVREKTGTSTWTVRGNIKGADGAQGIQGVPGANGANGQDGTDGSTWYNGVSNPTTQGVVGDWYIKTSTWDVYRKISSNSWNHYGNIKGEDGVPADVSNKANIDGSNTAGGEWKIDNLKNDAVGNYLDTYSLDNGLIGIPPTDALGLADGILLMKYGGPLAISENTNPDWDGYIYRAGLPLNGYPVQTRRGNYIIESKHRFRVHNHESLDALDSGVGKVILNPYNAIEHQYFDVNVLETMDKLELDIQWPERDELTGHLIRRNTYGQRISVNVRNNTIVAFTNVQGVSFTKGGNPGVYKYVWVGVWLFDGYSPNEF